MNTPRIFIGAERRDTLTGMECVVAAVSGRDVTVDFSDGTTETIDAGRIW